MLGGENDSPAGRAISHSAVLILLAVVLVVGVLIAAWRLGAGRARKEDPVSAAAGVICLAKPGEQVERGQPVLELRADDEARFGRAIEALDGGIEIGSEPPVIGSPVLERIG